MSDDDLPERRESDDPTPGDGTDADGKIDHMAPPREPCECWCMHCRRTFMSSEMWFQRVIGDPQGFEGFWMCPTPNCGGAGFTFDIFPTDPDHPANEGWVEDDDGEDEEEFFDDQDEDEEIAALGLAGECNEGSAGTWDPNETKWKELDEALGDDADDDLEGEEWKHGLQPGERPPEPDWMEEARREQEEREREYDEPDRRPREIDWSDRADRQHDDRSRPGGGGGGEWNEDDIPF